MNLEGATLCAEATGVPLATMSLNASHKHCLDNKTSVNWTTKRPYPPQQSSGLQTLSTSSQKSIKSVHASFLNTTVSFSREAQKSENTIAGTHRPFKMPSAIVREHHVPLRGL